MAFKILKKLVLIIVIALLLFIVVLTAPRMISFLRPGKPPVGYHFVPLAYIALRLGLEELVNMLPALPSEVEEIKNIEYRTVNGKSLALDLYRPSKLHGKVPLLVFIHGGGWKGGDRTDYQIYTIYFAAKGYVTATVSYRLLKDGHYPACAEDITAVVGWFFEHGDEYGYDENRIALIGGSAGAHLATLAAYGWKQGVETAVRTDTGLVTTKSVKAVVDIYGPVDLTTEYARKHELVTGLIGKSWEEAPELYREASPSNYLDSSDPPTLILHGTSDDLVPVSQSENLKVKLDSLGVPCVLVKFPLWPHTMDVAVRVNDYCKKTMEEFFGTYL